MSFKAFFIFFLIAVAGFGSDLLEKMSLEEKVGQLLIAHFHGEKANEDARALVQDVKVGGIIYYNWANGLTSFEQVKALSSGLQQMAAKNLHPIPLLIIADQEGGVVARLQEGFTQFPGNRALGETNDPNLAEQAAFASGQEMLAAGINMNLAPVIDVNSNPRNPVIGVRSFGDCPEKVSSFGEKALRGFRRAGVLSALKHFPGHGDVSIDSHADLPIVHKSKEELERMELLPFKRLSPLADAIVTAHILIPALDPENCATLSKPILNELREGIGFRGVIISDSLVMEGVLKKCQSVDEAVIAAFNAGCDLLVLGGKLLTGAHAGFELKGTDVCRIHRSLVEAVQSGRISEERLNEAVSRILSLKKQMIFKDSGEIASSAHRALAQNIASLALKKIGSMPFTSLKEKNVLVIASDLLKKNIEKTPLLQVGKSTSGYFFHQLNPSESEIEAAKIAAKKADVIVICCYNAWKNPSAVALTNELLDQGKPCILLALRDPLDASLFPKAALVFKSFSPSIPSIQAICEQLK